MCPRSPVTRDALHAGSFLLVVVLVLLLAGGATASGVLAADSAVPAQQDGTQDDAMVLQNNTIAIDLSSDGDAHWTVSWTFSLPEEDGNDQFQQLAAELENGGETDYLGTLETLRNASQRVDAARDRQTRIVNESWTSSRSGTGANATGRLSLSFTWENFARIDGNRLIIDDVLVTPEQGVWLDGLTADQKLIIRIPSSYGVIDANVDVQDRALRWQGPTTFDGTTLQATLIGDRSTPTPTPSEGTPILLWGVGGFLLLAAALAGYLWYRFGGLPAPAEPEDDGDESPAAAENSPAVSPPPPDDEPVNEEPAEIQEELLSDEERVERLLEANGGRMKQADIVEETDWSNAKVSQLLSSMEEEDRIDKLRIGRENLISFPDVDVTEIRNDE